MNISIKWKKRVIRSNLQGLSNIVRADSSLFQFVWFFFYIISSLVTVFLIGQSILKFMKCKVDANVRRNIVTQLDFPKITICNRNPLSSDYFLDLYNKVKVPLHKYQYYVLLPLESYMRNTSERYLTLAEKQNMTDLEGLVISCMFKNKPCSLKEDFIFIYEPYYQNCIRFNSGFVLLVQRKCIRPANSLTLSSTLACRIRSQLFIRISVFWFGLMTFRQISIDCLKMHLNSQPASTSS